MMRTDVKGRAPTSAPDVTSAGTRRAAGLPTVRSPTSGVSDADPGRGSAGCRRSGRAGLRLTDPAPPRTDGDAVPERVRGGDAPGSA
ncbi:hypothetical protein EAO69_23215 [Streptomyces sp. me109]|nr:hypothetical protein EAO69_23215 [Streptomyces sp. me109]